MVTHVFGDMLYCPESDGLDEFPSPNDLKHKIILSTKPPKEYLDTNKVGKTSAMQEKDSSDDEDKVKTELLLF